MLLFVNLAMEGVWEWSLPMSLWLFIHKISKQTLNLYMLLVYMSFWHYYIIIIIYWYSLEQRSKSHNNQNNVLQPVSNSNNTYGPPVQMNGNEIAYLLLTIYLSSFWIVHSGKSHKNKGKNSKNKKYTKDQIGLPENFRHVQHIGWDPDRGFDLGQIKDPQLNTFFAKVRCLFFYR